MKSNHTVGKPGPVQSFENDTLRGNTKKRNPAGSAAPYCAKSGSSAGAGNRGKYAAAQTSGKAGGPRRKKSGNGRIGRILVFGILTVLIISVIIVACKTFLPGSNSESKSNSASNTSGSSQVVSPTSSEVSSVSASADPEKFWGNNIDFSASINPLKGSSPKMDKWPEEPGFDLVKTDISVYLSKKYGPGALSGITVILDPGHGGEDLGAVYPRAPEKPEIIESKINLTIATLVKKKLEELGATVVLTRTDNSYNKLYYRAAVAAKATLSDFYSKLSPSSANRGVIEEYLRQMDLTMKANNDEDESGWFFSLGIRREVKNILDLQSANTNFLFISLHCNSSEKADSRHGTYVYYTSNSVVYADEAKNESGKTAISPEYQNYDDEQRKKFATLLYDNIIEDNPDLTPNDPKNSIISKNYCVIREQNLVSALIELGYVNHTKDRAFLLDTGNQDNLSESIVKAIYQYYCVK